MMNEDYLWDRTGEPDGQLAELEKGLGTLRWSPSAGTAFLPNIVPPPRRLAVWWTAAVAGFLLLTAGCWIAYRLHTPARLTSWTLSLSGEQAKPMYLGQVVETAESVRGTITSEFVGRVDIEPDSRLRMLAASTSRQRLALDKGTIHAFIWAPPAQFVVDTPGAKAVDLGCQYTLRVDKSGVGFLTVEAGWVAFDWHGAESFIPAGAACFTRPDHGPDPPYFLDASTVFKNATAEFELDGRKQALFAALASARKRDALTLWHLLVRVPADDRGEVFDRLAALIAMPTDVNRDAVLRGDRRSIDSIWNALDLGNTSWWREWKRQW